MTGGSLSSGCFASNLFEDGFFNGWLDRFAETWGIRNCALGLGRSRIRNSIDAQAAFTEGGLSKLVLLVAFGTRALSALRVFTGATAHQTKKSRASPAFLDQAKNSRSECVFQADGIGIGANCGGVELCDGAKIFVLKTSRQGRRDVVRNADTNQR